MDLSITKRRWLSNESALSILEENVQQLCTTVEVGKKYGVTLYVSVSTPSNSLIVLDEAMAVRIAEVIEKLRKGGVGVWYDTNGATAGYKFAEALFPETLPICKSSETVFALCCFDQFPLHELAQLEAAIDLSRKLIRDNKFYATGSRNVPVTLGVDAVAGDMRVIEESIYNLATSSNAFKTRKPVWAQVSPVYERFGEITSGFYFVNPTHHLFETMREEVRARSDIISKPGFTIEYLTAMRSGAANVVSAGYVYAARNHFDVQVDPANERATVLQTIEQNAQMLGTTSVKGLLRDLLYDHTRFLPLQEFFDDSTIDDVCSAISKGLRQNY